MTPTIVAIPADVRQFDGYVWHATPHQYVDAAMQGANAIPLLVPVFEEGIDVDAVLDRVDGVLISGSRTNVHPSLYGEEATEAHGPFDPARDATSLDLIRRAIDRGVPLLAICRGIQELNVALGGDGASTITGWPPAEETDLVQSGIGDEIASRRRTDHTGHDRIDTWPQALFRGVECRRRERTGDDSGEEYLHGRTPFEWTASARRVWAHMVNAPLTMPTDGILPAGNALAFPDRRQRLPRREPCPEIVDDEIGHGIARMDGRRGDMREQAGIRQLHKRFRHIRLAGDDIQPGGGDRPL
jgi:hypothetical protein